MSPRHLLLALTVAVVWGVNFVFIEIGLESFPPLLFTCLRFGFAAVPAIFLVRRPGVPWRYVVTVGLVLGVGQFGLLFLGMAHGMPAGLSSLVAQSQVGFTLLFAVVLLGERPRPIQVAGVAIAGCGIVLIAVDRGLTAPAGAFALLILSAACWGAANIATRLARPPEPVSFMVWASAVAAGPLLVLSLIFEGPHADWQAIRSISLAGVVSLAYLVVLATLVGHGLWSSLLRRYDAGVVAPFSLLVPVVGMAAAWIARGEVISPLRFVAAGIILGGLAVTVVRRRRAVPVAVPVHS